MYALGVLRCKGGLLTFYGKVLNRRRVAQLQQWNRSGGEGGGGGVLRNIQIDGHANLSLKRVLTEVIIIL